MKIAWEISAREIRNMTYTRTPLTATPTLQYSFVENSVAGFVGLCLPREHYRQREDKRITETRCGEAWRSFLHVYSA